LGCGLDAVFDLASLTKPLATVHAFAELSTVGTLDLQDTVGQHLPEAEGPVADVTLEQLLRHESGMNAWLPLHSAIDPQKGDPLTQLRLGALSAPLGSRPGESTRYSDLGFITLAWICERAGLPVDELRVSAAGRFLCPPLDAAAGSSHLFLPSGHDAQGRALLGRVHDENCRSSGGVGAGHAGWFGTIGEVLKAGEAWLDASLGGDKLAPDAQLLTQRGAHQRTAGFDVPTPGGTTGGGFGPRSFGHLGFTGTALWIDPDAELVAVLLTNRTWPDGEDRGIADLRRAYFSWCHPPR